MLVFTPQCWQIIKMTFGPLRAQEISAIIFQCSMLYHTEFDFLWLFIHLRPRMASNTLYYWWMFLFFLWNIIWTCSVGAVTSLSVAFISFFNQSSHKFLPIFFLSYWFHKIESGVTVLVQDKRSIYFAMELSLCEISYVRMQLDSQLSFVKKKKEKNISEQFVCKTR